MNSSNSSGDSFLGWGDESLTLIEAAMIGPTLTLIVCVTIIGNLFVIFAILFEKDLRRPQYYLIWSLALADLFVGVLVTPIATLYELQRRWTLGVTVCDLWTSADVLCCTASILHLVAIALDRYWSVTDVTYMQRRTPGRILSMLAVVWIVSLGLSTAPIFGWKDAKFKTRVTEERVCLISQDKYYQTFSTMTAFYLPLCAIIFIYWRVYRAAKQRFQRGRERKAPQAQSPTQPLNTQRNGVGMSNDVGSSSKATAVYHKANDAESGATCVYANSVANLDNDVVAKNGDLAVAVVSETRGTAPTPLTERRSTSNLLSSAASTLLLRKKRSDGVTRKKKPKESAESKRERKAWRTLAIITGTFVGCWLPFFVIAVIRLVEPAVPRVIDALTLWLGYLNSAMNPIIYTIFSPDFRMAFQRMLKRICFWRL